MDTFISKRAAFMKDSLLKSQTITDSVVTVLGSFDHRLSTLETAMRPIQINTRSIRKGSENIDKTLKTAELILVQFDASYQAEAKILKGPQDNLENYLVAIEQLRNTIQCFNANKNFRNSDVVLNHSNEVLSKAILKLEEEFHKRLAYYSKPVEPDRLFERLPSSLRPSSGSPGIHPTNHHGEHHDSSLETAVYTPPNLIPPRALAQLHDLAKQIVGAGGQQRLIKIYRGTRSSVLEQSLLKLGAEKLGREDVQKMQWGTLEAKIENWISVVRIAVKLLFAGEMIVCDKIFEGFDAVKDQCFAEATFSSFSFLLTFGQAIAKLKRSPEKLFVLLNMYEIMRELHSEIEILFKGKACTETRESALALTKQLAQTAQETFGDFEEVIEKDASKTVVANGNVHPLTSYVINYVKFLFDYHSTLKQLFQELENGSETTSGLASVTARLMQALETNLDEKSKQYKEPALTHIFLMNNIHYMVRFVKSSEAKDLLADDWVPIHRRTVQQHANLYKRSAWTKILQCLSIQGLTSSSGSDGVPRALVKERFRIFNVQFDELHQKQSQWTVPDTELRESLLLAVSEVLLPAYRSLLRPLVESVKNQQRVIIYTEKDLERMLDELFQKKTMNDPHRS